jgi:outer membrane lipoprotein LolB
VIARGLAACSTLAPPPRGGEAMAGRLSVRVESDPPRSVAAAFELRGSPQAGELDLSTPLGSLMARARCRRARSCSPRRTTRRPIRISMR